jgi:hypothetical protein
MEDDIEIFKGKKFSSLCKDIYMNSQNTRNQIEILISEVRTHVTDINSALTLIPLIKDFLDVTIKNDDQLIKLAAIVQRIVTKPVPDGGGGLQLSEDERKQLMEEVDAVNRAASKVEEKKTKALEDEKSS